MWVLSPCGVVEGHPTTAHNMASAGLRMMHIISLTKRTDFLTASLAAAAAVPGQVRNRRF